MMLFLYFSNDTTEFEMIKSSFLSSYVNFVQILFVQNPIAFKYYHEQVVQSFLIHYTNNHTSKNQKRNRKPNIFIDAIIKTTQEQIHSYKCKYIIFIRMYIVIYYTYNMDVAVYILIINTNIIYIQRYQDQNENYSFTFFK